MSAATLVTVERSFLQPGLRTLAVTRCPTLVEPRMPPPFEPPEAVADAKGAGAAEGGMGAEGSAAEPGDFGAVTTVGGNVLSGGAYGFFRHLARPGLEKASRNAGSLGPVVRVAGEAGVYGIASLVGGALTGTARRLGSVVSRVPLLGANSAVGAALQFGLGVFVGDKLGEFFTSGEDDAVPEIFLSQLCVMCNTPFDVGSGHRVAALACGHACLCNSTEDGQGSCADVYMAKRGDCPLCRAQPVSIGHSVII
mmetsp:Transcript_35618/g.101479  ORF Transcript_35618/g.101479 Transcript_35618/m.101479 type:complete len:253 (+) Transcript_35618:74-832(+)